MMIRVFVSVVIMAGTSSLAWSPNPFSVFSSPRVKQATLFPSECMGTDESDMDSSAMFASRRAWLGTAAMQIGLLGAAGPVLAANAADDAGKSATTTTIIYKSGKAPIVPGAKPRDKGDTKGTRKDPDFLRSIADCRSQCMTTLGSDGYAKAKEDCLSDCQDICCKTYEQCTFDIVPRI